MSLGESIVGIIMISMCIVLVVMSCVLIVKGL